MADGFENSSMIGLGVAGALAKQYADDQHEFLPLIARVLKDAMPDGVEIVETGLFKKSLKSVAVIHGENRLKLEDVGRGPLQASFTRVVRGIALKTEPLTVEEWLAGVSEALEHAAKSNEKARMALARTLDLV